MLVYDKSRNLPFPVFLLVCFETCNCRAVWGLISLFYHIKSFPFNFTLFFPVIWWLIKKIEIFLILKKGKFSSRNISGSFRNITEILRNILKNFKKVLENFDNYYGEFWELFHNILRNILENSENYCGKFRKSFQIVEKNFGDFEKYFGHLRDVFPKISENNFQK